MRRQLLGDYILNIIRRFSMVDESKSRSWVKKAALPQLANIAYCQETNCQPALSEKTRILFQNRLMSAFAHVLADTNGYSYSCDLLQSFSPDAVQMDDDIAAARNRAISTMEKILKKSKKASNEEKAPLQALALLYSLAKFQLYNGEPEAVSILEELKICYDKLIRHKHHDDSDLDGSEVLVELLLSFISKPSALLRKVAQQVFSAFMVDITADGLKLMSNVLESSESLRGQHELFDQDPDVEQMENTEKNEGTDSDVEILDMNGEEGHLKTHLDPDQDTDDDDEEDKVSGEEGDDEDAKKLDDALAKALGTSRLDPDAMEEDSDSDADMTDSEMMALDSKLVEIFSQRKKQPNKKQEQKDAKETMVNFKSRVLDLLEIYVKKQAGNPLAFDLLLPLLRLIKSTKSKQLAEKAHTIILSFAKASKGLKSTEGAAVTNASEQLKLMKAIHVEASKDPSHMFAKAASTASLLVASSLYRADKGVVKKIATIYRDSQVAWLEGRVKMQTAFFMEWVNWCQSRVNIQKD